MRVRLFIALAFFASPAEPLKDGIREAPLPCLIAIGITTLGCLVLFFDPHLLFALSRMVAGG